jgi:flagellar biosynthesis protein FliQ
MMSTKNLLKRLIWWILCAVLSVLCVVLIVGILYSVAGVDVTLKPR